MKGERAGWNRALNAGLRECSSGPESSTPCWPLLLVSHDSGLATQSGPAVLLLSSFRNSNTPIHPPSLLAAYDACATPKEQEMLLSTVKCGQLQR